MSWRQRKSDRRAFAAAAHRGKQHRSRAAVPASALDAQRSQKERCALLDKAFEGAHPYLASFLKLLCEEDLLGELPGCLRAYQDRYNVDHNILEVTAVSAIALTAPSREKLLAKLQKMTGKNIVLTETVDPAVLGGLRLDMDGTRLDGTVQRHLERLRTEIDGAVL